MGLFSSKAAFDPATDIPDLSGKTVLVTGGNVGIGQAFVRAVAAHNPERVYLCARRQASAEDAVKEIQQTQPKANIDILALDLNSFDSIKKCAEVLNAKSARLDYVFLNAGIASTSPCLTKEGYETTFGVNHVGHAYFAQLIMPLVLKTQKEHNADVRITITSSIAARQLAPKEGINTEEMKTTLDKWHPMKRYGNSKLANVLLAKKLAQEYPSITTVSHHPGTVMSEIWGKASDMKLLVWVLWPFLWATAITTDQGALCGLWTVFADKSKVKNGAYYEPVDKLTEDSKFNQAGADQLWDWTNAELKAHGAPGWP